MSNRHIEEIEKAHRFCIKYIQNLPKRMRTDVALGLIGSNPIIAEIDIKKFSFLGQLCCLPSQAVYKQIFNQRLTNYIHGTSVRYGFVPDILNLLDNCFFFFDLSFTALSRIFHLYRADRSSKVSENRRTRGKTT